LSTTEIYPGGYPPVVELSEELRHCLWIIRSVYLRKLFVKHRASHYYASVLSGTDTWATEWTFHLDIQITLGKRDGFPKIRILAQKVIKGRHEKA
jgi:hypothetical protein